MNSKEIAFAKQALLATRDWDTYQSIIRKCLRIHENERQSQKNVCSAGDETQLK